MILYPIDKSGAFTEAASPPLEFEFPYKKGSAPNVERQDKPHAHHVLEDSKGLIYVCDLGSDRVWVLEKKGEDQLGVKGYLQAPEGSGPRHAILSSDGMSLYPNYIPSQLYPIPILYFTSDPRFCCRECLRCAERETQS